jgi:hypothetical protein
VNAGSKVAEIPDLAALRRSYEYLGQNHPENARADMFALLDYTEALAAVLRAARPYVMVLTEELMDDPATVWGDAISCITRIDSLLPRDVDAT